MVCSLPLKGGFIFKLAQDLNRSDVKAHLVVKAMLLDGKVEEAHHIREEEEPTQVGGPNPLASMQEVQSKLGPTVASKTQRGSTVTSVSLPPPLSNCKNDCHSRNFVRPLASLQKVGSLFSMVGETFSSSSVAFDQGRDLTSKSAPHFVPKSSQTFSRGDPFGKGHFGRLPSKWSSTESGGGGQNI